MEINTSLLSDPFYKKSESENNGLALIDNSVLSIYCPGISTGGFAEISMALAEPRRRIVATTLDEKGILETQKLLEKYTVQSQITLKIEDVSKPLPYENEYFDFIYARLVLHYLANTELQNALQELYRILKTGNTLFVVVRSFDWESEVPESTHDVETGMTSYPEYDDAGKVRKYVSRNLHSEETIKDHLVKAGFKIKSLRTFEETIYGGYLRIRPNEKPSSLIEVVAEK